MFPIQLNSGCAPAAPFLHAQLSSLLICLLLSNWINNWIVIRIRMPIWIEKTSFFSISKLIPFSCGSFILIVLPLTLMFTFCWLNGCSEQSPIQSNTIQSPQLKHVLYILKGIILPTTPYHSQLFHTFLLNLFICVIIHNIKREKMSSSSNISTINIFAFAPLT